ncbi:MULTISPECIES: methionine adenosyltransferase [Devosia]|uniref:Methionine adenosyltransferase n=1 Tax=Devosia equisanguinis TaxID=2490941 RepID=A0A447I6P4_9HYPH|nr:MULTISPECIES: methionine adenosyltransferase [Devosia]ODT48190.1 MAG: methionine adenosyltransferase [Pelagibacterium sp. SCN 63-126]ODU85359.1 MAG: methionine adenosyltransferase [Pelagibacterium sp. SCN 63-17]OJX42101.1 MAG: methionine adenosyltransferase [Devosia sp. 63-57]VDS03123.1 S-adenosylmethionine synthase [Devosia equisanguinis]
MARSSYLFTSESVSEGHPDKVCDRISDEIVDLVFKEAKKAGMDPASVRIACETLATTNRVVIAGEVRVPDTLLKRGKDGKVLHDAAGAPLVNPSKFKSAARKAIRAIGYEQPGFHWKTCRIDVLLHGQSADIAQGVDASGDKDVGAGDQGIMFGYASRETPELLPAPIYYAHKILETLTEARKSGTGPAAVLGPDAKSQVTVKYQDGQPVGVTQIVLSTQHLDETLTSADVRRIVEPYIRQALPDGWISDETVWHINPTGKFVVGGPDGDAGLTGRKIIVDTYGGAAPHGGGAFSGKDPTKVDRSAAYAARYLAKNVVAAGLADRATIQLSYAIGVAKPLSIYVDLHGTGKVDEAKLETALAEVMDLTPRGIRTHLDLNKPIYAKTSAYGHFGRKAGRDGSFSWEKTDLVKALKEAVR